MADWKKIKAEYIRGASYRKLADKYDVPFSTIQKVGAREKWTELRKKSRLKLDEKIVNSVAEREARRVDVIMQATDRLLQKITDGIDDGTLTADATSIRQLMLSLRDACELKGIKNELDMQEQIARIEKLRKDAQSEDEKSGSIEVKIADDIEEYTE